MNNSIGRLLDGISTTLREDVIPRIEDPYARGQAVGVIDLLNNLRPRVDWAREPLQTQLQGLHEGVRSVERTLQGAAATPPAYPVAAIPPAGPSTEDLLELRARIEDHIARLFQWLDERRDAGEAVDAAEAVLRRAVHDDLEREMKLVSKPLFAEIAAGAKGAEKS